MKKIDRYITKYLFVSFIGSVTVLTMILLLNTVFQLLDLLVRKGVPFSMVLKLIAYTLPFIMNMTFPMSFLVAGLLTFGRMSAHNEFLSMKSSGIDIKIPLFRLSILLLVVAILNALFNLYVLPETNFQLKKTLLEIRIKKPAIDVEPGVFNKIENYLIFASSKDEKTGTLFDVKVQELKRDGVRFISAEKGKIYSTTRGGMAMELFNGEFIEAKGENKEEFRRGTFKKDRILIKLDEDLFYRDVIYRSDREKSLKGLLKDIEDVKKEMKMYPKDDNISKHLSKRRINSILTEINMRLALPFASIIFVAFSFPIAIKFKFSGYGSSLGVSFFFFIIYYILLLLGQEISRRTLITPYLTIWAPNILFGIFAGILTGRELKK